MAGQIFEVVGGGDTGGVIVRISRQGNSPQFPQRLTSGSLVMGRELVGDRLLYDRIAGTGYGPDSGWVCLRQGSRDLLIEVDVKPPKHGWKVLTAELPTYIPPPPPPPEAKQALKAPYGMSFGMPSSSPTAQIRPQTEQKPGKPFTFYHQICFNDTKGSGLRMSACLAAMDSCRTDLFALCDNSITSFRHVENPFTGLALELRPDILRLKDDDGLLYAHPQSTGPILSWLRLEAQFGWPMFPMRNEEQKIYFVGKDKLKPPSLLSTGRFQCAFTDSSQDPKTVLAGETWEADLDKFMGSVKSDHSSPHLDERSLFKLYPSSGVPFTPKKFAKVSWLMSSSYTDIWKILYHCKTPEVLWDVNMLAGDAFAALVRKEQDPQAIAVTMPKAMSLGTVYDVYCFLEEEKKKASYIFLPQGSTTSGDTATAVVALYDWSSSCPSDGCSLCSEDLEVINAPGRMHMIAYATGGEPKTTRYLNLESLP